MRVSDELFGSPSKLIMDPVHEGIPFFDHEISMIDHPLFQRLRHIDQTDVMSLVFPGATHTRFLHSLGTMHLSSKVFQSLLRNHLEGTTSALVLNDSLTGSEEDSAKRLRKITASFAGIQYFHFCLRIAALMHDIGHLPFSHLLENLAHSILNDKRRELFREIWADRNWEAYYQNDYLNRMEDMTHEHYSVICAYEILHDKYIEEALSPIFDTPKELQDFRDDVLRIMETTERPPSETFEKHVYPLALRFFQKEGDYNTWIENAGKGALAKGVQRLLRNIISGELGADRMDFLLRDSYFSGSKYGVYNLDHLVSNFRVGYLLHQEYDKEPWVGIAVRSKGLRALEDFLSSRFQLYAQVYNHKTALGLKWLLNYAIEEVLSLSEFNIRQATSEQGKQEQMPEEQMSRKQLQREQILQHLKNVEAFQQFTDAFFWERIREIAKCFPDSACAKILRREHPKWLHAERNTPSWRIDIIRSDLEELHGCQVIDSTGYSKYSDIGTGRDNEDIRLLTARQEPRPYISSTVLTRMINGLKAEGISLLDTQKEVLHETLSGEIPIVSDHLFQQLKNTLQQKGLSLDTNAEETLGKVIKNATALSEKGRHRLELRPICAETDFFSKFDDIKVVHFYRKPYIVSPTLTPCCSLPTEKHI